jgi:hypothetical protein
MGLGPWNAEPNDLIFILKGGKTPFLLRPTPEADKYALVGEAYVYGIMGGELFRGESALGVRDIYLV